MSEIPMFVCSACGCKLTSIIKHDVSSQENLDMFQDDLEVTVETHFDISRSNKNLFIEGNEIVEDVNGSNEKMHRYVCEYCFQKICDESETIRKMFLIQAKLVW